MLGMADHTPSDTAYRGGCRCVGCKHQHALAAQRTRAKNPDIRARRPSRKKSNVVEMTTARRTTKAKKASPPAEMGAVETAIRAQLALMPEAVAERPGEAAALVAIAARLDDPETYGGATSSLVSTLQKGIDALRAQRKTKSGGKLHTVSAMTNRTRRKAN